MWERLAPMYVRHLLLDKCLISPQTFVQQKSRKTRVLRATTLSDQQMLYNNVGACSPSFTSQAAARTISSLSCIVELYKHLRI